MVRYQPGIGSGLDRWGRDAVTGVPGNAAALAGRGGAVAAVSEIATILAARARDAVAAVSGSAAQKAEEHGRGLVSV